MSAKLNSREHAVVIGGSIAGLMVAGVLANYYTKVTLLDGDSLGSAGEARKATPQANHVHGLLSSGWTALQEIFPTIEPRLRACGAHWLHFGKDFRWHHFGKAKAQFEEHMHGPFMSRSCLESSVYEEVGLLEHVEIVHQCKALSLLGNKQKIEGVVTDTGEEILADLVVEASGRSSRLPEWLRDMGLAAVRKETIPAGLRYSSCRFRPSPDFVANWKALFVIPKPPLTKSGAIFPVNNGDWLVTLAGRHGEKMPTNQQEFLEFTQGIYTDEITLALEGATPVSELKSFRYKESRRYFYEEAKLPEGIVVVGDALCSFNPIFGQGMTVCALEALELRNLLEASTQFDAQKYFNKVRGIVQHAWEMIIVEDLRHEHLHDQRSTKVKLMQWLTEKVYDKTAECGALNKKLYEVIHFSRPATDLCKPSVLWKLMR